MYSTRCTSPNSHLDAEWVSGWSIPLNDMPLFVNQELGEVPLDVLTEGTGFAGFQKLVDGCSIFAVDVNLTGKNKGKVLKLCNLRITPT